MSDTTNALRDLLEQGLVWHAEYGRGLANHLPMALQALQALGASRERMGAFARNHAGRLRRRSDARDSAFETHAQAFAAAIARDGRDAVLRRELPPLLRGVSAAAFHGLIRTAHAVQSGHGGELAMGLAYWAHRHTELVPRAPVDGELPLSDWLAALQQLRPSEPIEGSLIQQRIRRWAEQPGWAALATRLHVDDHTLRDLARAAAALYAASGNFTVLHLVTACRALHTLMPWIDDPDQALRHFSIAAAAALKAADAEAGAAPAALPWQEIVARAIASNDEHVIKLAHAARYLEQAFGGEIFRLAATRAVATQEAMA